MIKKSYEKAVTIIVVLFLGGLFLWLTVSCITTLVNGPPKMFDELFIFENIDECKELQNYKEGTVENLEIPEQDSSGRNITNSYTAKYKNKDVEFEIYAYEFATLNESKSFFEFYAGERMENVEKDYFLSKTMFKTELYVMENNKAYCVRCSAFDTDEVLSILSEVFSIKIA